MRIALTVAVLLATLASAGVANTSPIAVSVPWSRPAVGTGEAMNSTGSMNGMAMGVASMHRVAFVPVRAHATIKLAPGGYHIMLIGLNRDLRANQTFPLRLRFSYAGWVAVSVRVQPI